MGNIVDLDKSVFLYLNSFHSPLFDVAMSLFTRTEFWVLFFLTIVYYLFKNLRTKAVLILIALALVILVADQFSGLIKDVVGRLRPSHDPTIQDLVHIVKRRGGQFGYFSAHAANTFGIAMYLTLLFKNKHFGFVIFSWAAIATYTRIYLGLHFPGDILTGMVFGIFVGWLLYQLTVKVDKRFFVMRSPRLAEVKLDNKEARIMGMVLVAIVCFTILIASRLLRMGIVTL